MKVCPVGATMVHVDSGQTNMMMLMAFCSYVNMPKNYYYYYYY